MACDEPDADSRSPPACRGRTSSRSASGASMIDFICSPDSRPTRPSIALKSARAWTGGGNLPFAGRPARTSSVRSPAVELERVQLLAIDLQHRLVAQIEGRLVEGRFEVRRDQEDLLVVGALRVQVGAGRRLLADQQRVLLAARLEGDLDARLRQAVLLRGPAGSRRRPAGSRATTGWRSAPTLRRHRAGRRPARRSATRCRLLQRVRSPDSDLTVISSILSASTVKTLSFFGPSSPAGF